MSELSNVELNIKEMVTIILSNIGKMLHRRGMIKKNHLPEKVVEHILSDKMHNFELDGHKLSIHIMNFEIKHISANSPVDEYINKNGEYYKFIIVKNFTKKTFSQITKDYKNVEIFTTFELLEDIPSKEFIPEHNILTPEEKTELTASFGLSELGRIYSTDIMSRYYGAKLNDIFRIIRPNLNSGTSIYYRIVIPGSMEIFA